MKKLNIVNSSLKVFLSLLLVTSFSFPSMSFADESSNAEVVGEGLVDSEQIPSGSSDGVGDATQDKASSADSKGSEQTTPEGSDDADASSVSKTDAKQDATKTEVPYASESESEDSDISNDALDADAVDETDEQADDSEAKAVAEGATNLPSLGIIKSSIKSTFVLDVSAGSLSNSATIQLYTDNVTAAQRWTFKLGSDGYYTITNVGSGKVLDVRNGVAKNGARIQQFQSNGSDAQKWKAVASKSVSGAYTFVSKLDESLALDVQSGVAGNGTVIQLYDLNSTKAQSFTVEACTQSVADGSYVVSSALGSKVLDVAAASWSNGANIQMYSSNKSAAQTFTLKYDKATGYYTIKTLSGAVLDCASGGTSNGTNVQQWKSNSTSAQKWAITKTSGGYTVRVSSCGLALDVAGASTTNGANVQIYQSNGSKAQIWKFSSASNESVAEGLYTINSALNTNYVADIVSGSSSSGANVDLYKSNGTWAQKFNIRMEGKYCVIENLKSGKVLDCQNGGTSAGTNVWQYDYNGSDAQLWLPVSYGGNCYGFKSKLSGLYLDVSGGSASNGQNIQIWTGNGSNAQKFYLNTTDRTTAVSEGSYEIISQADSLVLDISAASKGNGASVQLYTNNGSYAQKFKILKVGNGYGLVNVHSSKYLDVDTGTNTKLQQWDRTAASNQQWSFVACDKHENCYFIKSLSTGKYLTNNNGKLALSKYSGATNQQFQLVATQAFKVYLDSGHGWNSSNQGEYDGGATGSGYSEASLTAELTKLIAKRLDAMGVEYELVTGKNTVHYRQRQTDAKQRGCSTFLSIHFNAGGGTGTESYIHSYNAAVGSATYQSIMHPYLLRGTGLTNRGARSAAFAVCGGTLPSILCEIAFIDNASDMSIYQSRKNIIAEQLAMGLLQASKNSACGWY